VTAYGCIAEGCTTSTGSTSRFCWEHRPAPPVTREGGRVYIGTGLCLAPAAARDLTVALADILLEDTP
jgi:hypothetical protein